MPKIPTESPFRSELERKCNDTKCDNLADYICHVCGETICRDHFVDREQENDPFDQLCIPCFETIYPELIEKTEDESDEQNGTYDRKFNS